VWQPTHRPQFHEETLRRLYGGIDLPSNHSVVVIQDEADRRLFERRLRNDLPTILRALAPFASELEGLVVESTYHGCWLVDGLVEAGYRVHLAHTAAIRTYPGLKHGDDFTNASWLAHRLRLELLAAGNIYPKAGRGLATPSCARRSPSMSTAPLPERTSVGDDRALVTGLASSQVSPFRSDETTEPTVNEDAPLRRATPGLDPSGSHRSCTPSHGRRRAPTVFCGAARAAGPRPFGGRAPCAGILMGDRRASREAGVTPRNRKPGRVPSSLDAPAHPQRNRRLLPHLCVPLTRTTNG